MINFELLERIRICNGHEKNVRNCIGELMELGVALDHGIRRDIVEELADVCITANMIAGDLEISEDEIDDVINYKLKRTRNELGIS